MNALILVLPLFALILFGRVSAAQTIALSGDVRSVAGAPIDQAKVRIEMTDISALSNDQGHFELAVPESLSGQSITLSARIIGFASSQYLVRMSGSPKRRDFILESCPMSIWDPGDPPEHFAELPSPAAILQALALPDLKRSKLTAPHEFRVWIWRRAEDAFDLFRFVDSGGVKSGEHISSTWSTHRCMHEARHDDVCGIASPSGTKPNIGNLFMCRRVEHETVDWSARWQVVENADARMLLSNEGRYDSNDVKRNPHYLVIESWNGEHYRIGSYALQLESDTIPRTPAERLASHFETLP